MFERYLYFKVNQSFFQLKDQLESTENRIFVERRKCNDIIKDYNTFMKQFPRNRYTFRFDFEKKEYFEVDAGTENAPKVEF